MQVSARVHAATSVAGLWCHEALTEARRFWQHIVVRLPSARTVDQAAEDALSAIQTAIPATRKMRVPHIYFMLAAFDLAAVGGGFYLSHHLSKALVDTVEVNMAWSERHNHIAALSRVATMANAPGNNVFASQDAKLELALFKNALLGFKPMLSEIEQDISDNVEPLSAQKPLARLARVRSAMAGMTANTYQLLDQYGRGDFERAAASMAKMDQSYGMLLDEISKLGGDLREIQQTQSKDQLVRIHALRNYEYLIASMIILMVAGVTLFGHLVGRHLQRKYDEVAAANVAAQAAETETRAHADRLAAVNDEVVNLNKALADQMEKLREAQADIVRKGKMSQLGQLTAMVAHEIRNPLGALRNSLFIVEDLSEGNVEMKPHLAIADRSIVRCDKIISELLDFARTRALKTEKLELDAWLHRTVFEQSLRLPQGVKVVQQLELGAHKVALDTSSMQRVIINLLTNASEAMVGKGDDPAKRVVSDPVIMVRSRMTTRGVEIVVSDNGPGIKPEHMARIRDPLFTTKNFGVGLGIPAIEKILEQHGGGLDIASIPGEGATMTAWFPAEQPEAPTPRAAEAARAAA